MSVSNLILPPAYHTPLHIIDTEKAIKLIKDTFERKLAEALGLVRVSAPLFVPPTSGLNDDLNGVERPVQFDILDLGEDVQIVQSLAKWKRMALHRYGFSHGTGLYTDMNAIRRDETLDNLHSVYVDQWDWEMVIDRSERTPAFLQQTVRKIVDALCDTQDLLCAAYPQIQPILKRDILFITSQELLDRYPDLTPFERENAVTREHGTVFLMQIGDKLSDGAPHDGRAPDYDDWSLNGDILTWNPVLNRVFEVSSMGIRVDSHSLAHQLELAGKQERRTLPFHKMLLEDVLPLTIGGGIGQSRICMLLLQKAHIGEVQASVWPQDMMDTCEARGIHLL